MNVIKSSIKGTLLALTGAGLLLGGNAKASIAIVDGGTNANYTSLITTNSVSLPLTVSTNASVLVVTVYDNNVDNVDVGPALYWTNNTTGIATSLTNFGTNTGYGWSSAFIYYLTNPVAGTGVVGGANTNEPGCTIFMQAYTLSGVDTTVAPVPVGLSSRDNENGNVTSLTTTTPSGTVSGSWMPVISCSYNGGIGHWVTNLSSSGTVVQNLYRDSVVGQLAVGYVQNLGAGVSTITAQGDVPQAGAMDLLGVIFTPLVTLAAPANVAATPELNKVKLTWADASGGAATGYIVLRSTTSGSGYTPIGTNSGNSATTYTDNNVTDYTDYYYVVEAIASGGKTSPNSAEAMGYGLGVPTTPTGLAAAADVNQVDLSWNNQLGAPSYNILRSTTSGSGFSQIETVTTTNYIDTSVTDGTLYYYEVEAANSYGTSSASSQASAIPVVKFLTNWIGVFNSSSDITGWAQTIGGLPASVLFYDASDLGGLVPPAPSSGGCLDMEATYGPSYTNNADFAIADQFPSINLSGYKTLEMDIENPTGVADEWGQLQAIQPSLQVPVGGYPTYEKDEARWVTIFATQTSWAHFVFPLSDWTNAPSLDNVTSLQLELYDGNCVPLAQTLDVSYANIAFCGAPAWTPTFAVTSQSVASGTTSVTLSGTISAIVAGKPVYLASNTVVSVSIRGSTQTTTISDATGDFSITEMDPEIRTVS